MYSISVAYTFNSTVAMLHAYHIAMWKWAIKRYFSPIFFCIWNSNQTILSMCNTHCVFMYVCLSNATAVRLRNSIVSGHRFSYHDNISMINFLSSRFVVISHTVFTFVYNVHIHRENAIRVYVLESPIFFLLKPEFLITHGIILYMP